MPVTILRTYKLSTSDGRTLILSEAEAQTLQVDETRATLTCDSSRCKARHAAENSVTVSWVEEDCQKDPTKIPDEVGSFIAFGQGKVACSPSCLKDYLTFDYVRPPSPRELRAKMEEEKKKQAEELKDLNPHLSASVQPMKVDYPAIRKAIESEDTIPDSQYVVPMPAVEVKALCQADGHADE